MNPNLNAHHQSASGILPEDQTSFPGRAATRCTAMLATLLLAITIAIPTGCATFGSGSTLQRVQTASKLAAYVGASEYLRSHPETRQAFELARTKLIQIESSEHVDFALLLSIVNQLPIKDLKSPRAQMLITSATIILSDFAGNLPVEQLDDLKPVARSIREGLDLALAE